MKRGIVALSIIATVAIGTSIAYRYWTRTPSYALTQIKEAIRNHDVVTFQKYVDVHSI
jgi:hypothetical protein